MFQNKSEKLFVQNIRCITNKIPSIEIVAKNNKIRALMLTKHWLQNNDIEVISIPGYVLAAHFSRINHIHGGVCIYLKEKTEYTNVSINELCIERDFEIAATKLTDSNIPLCTIYRSPLGSNNVYLKQLDLLLDKLNPAEN